MDRSEQLQQLVEDYESLIWLCSEDRLISREPEVVAELTRLGYRVEDLLGEMSDESLVMAVRNSFFRDKAFVELFVHRYQRYLVLWFFRWRVRIHDAEDLLQETYKKIWTRALHSYRPTCGSSSTFRAYLWRLAQNRVKEFYRGTRPGSLNGVPPPPDNGAGPELEAVGRELHERFEVAFRRLPAEEQLVLRRTMEGDKADVIATATGWPKPAVYRHLFRARRRIEQMLGLPVRTGDSAPAEL